MAPLGNQIGPDKCIEILLIELQQIYALALFRLSALDTRVPIIGGTLAAVLGTVVILPPSLQAMLLIAMPLCLLWLTRLTVGHARSFEDALRRIEEIEHAVNTLAGVMLLEFQSSHPSRGRRIGGRTGTETVEAVLAGSAVLLAGCLYTQWTILMPPPGMMLLYTLYIGIAALLLLVIRYSLDLYRYQPQVPAPDKAPSR